MSVSEQAFGFETHSLSDVGCVRSVNEDSVLTLPEAGVWLVADGMGGHAAGDFASQTIVQEIGGMGMPASGEDRKARVMDRLDRANRRILAHAAELGRGAIGSTIAALLIHDTRFSCVWAGDSRVYRLRAGALTRASRDHTEVQELIDAGQITAAQAADWPRKNVITRAIGVTEALECDVIEGQVAADDVFLLCSDGLTEYFDDPEIEARLQAEGGDLEALCAGLVATALERGGKDNVSVVLVRCIGKAPEVLDVGGAFPESLGY